MKTTTKVAIGIFAAIGVYLIYRMFSNYNSAGSPLMTTASNLQNSSQDTSVLSTNNYSVPMVPPSVGPPTEARSGRGHF